MVAFFFYSNNWSHGFPFQRKEGVEFIDSNITSSLNFLFFSLSAS